MTLFGRIVMDLEERLALVDDPFKSSSSFATNKSVEALSDMEQMSHDLDPAFSAANLIDVQSNSENLLLVMSGEANNEKMPVKVVKASSERRRCVVVPHWNAAEGDYDRLAGLMCRFGITSYIVTLPHHGVRSTSGTRMANEFLSADLDKTVSAVRQSVAEVRALVGWLSKTGNVEVVLLGVSLGSCIAGLASALERQVKSYVLVLGAGDFAETVWCGRATRHIRNELEGKITLQGLRMVWAEISPECYTHSIRANGSEIYLINGIYDSVVPPTSSQRFIKKLRNQGIAIRVSLLWCGHYTLGVFPFNVIVTFKIIRFILRRSR